MPDHQVERDRAARAGAEDRSGCQVERADQCSGIVGLLGYRSRPPARRARASGIAASIVSYDSKLVSEQLGRPGEIAGVSRRSGNKEQRRPIPLLLIIKGRSIDSG